MTLGGKGRRNKGHRGENEVEKIIAARELWTPDRALGGRLQKQGDILGLPGAWMDVKRHERIQILKWSREHEAKTPPHIDPVIAYRPNHEPWRISMLLDDYLDLLEEAQR